MIKILFETYFYYCKDFGWKLLLLLLYKILLENEFYCVYFGHIVHLIFNMALLESHHIVIIIMNA